MRSHKKRKGNKSAGTSSLTNDDYTLLIETMTKIDNQSLKNIDEKKIELTSSIIELLQTLYKAVEEVSVEVNYKPQLSKTQDLAIPSKERPSDVSIPIPPIKNQVLGEALNLGIKQMNAMVKNMGHVTINFSTLPMYEVYSIQNIAVA